jgi:hypothetical protein
MTYLAGRKISIIELPTNTLSAVKLLVPEILAALSEMSQGSYHQIKK